MSARAVPFHCPYCGEEDLEPYEEETPRASGHGQGGGWYCRSCARAFTLKFLGIGVNL